MQRERILRAMVEVVAERGYAGASVELVVSRARVSRRTFYRCFKTREACFLAVLDLELTFTRGLVSREFARQQTWPDGLCAALASLLVFLDSEPLLASVWLVESLAAGSWALRHRERNLAALRTLLISTAPATAGWSPRPLAAEGAMASVLGVIHAHILMAKSGPLIELLGPVMGLIAGHFLPSHAVSREIERGAVLAQRIQATRCSDGSHTRYAFDEPLDELRQAVAQNDGDSSTVDLADERAERSENVSVLRPSHSTQLGTEFSAILSNSNAHRARACLLFLADHPQTSNREIAVAIGVTHQSQMSKLLSCLLREHLVAKDSAGAGKRNSWCLTARGKKISRALRACEIGHIPADPADPQNHTSPGEPDPQEPHDLPRPA